MSLRRWIIRIVLSSVCLPIGSGASPQETTAFVNVTVIPMDREGAQAEWTVVVRGERIIEAGPASRVKVPTGARRIAAKGKYLMPGLVDTHIHASVKDDLLLFLAAGVTTVQGQGGAARQTQQWAREIAEGKWLGPNYVNCDTRAVGLKTAQEAERLIQQARTGGFDCIKLYSPPDWTAEAYQALIAAARRAGIRTVGHLPRNLPLETALRDGQQSIAHAEEYLYAHFNKQASPRDEALIPPVAKLSKESGVAVIPNLVAYHMIGLQTGATIEELMKRPELQYMPQFVRESWAPKLNRYRARFDESGSRNLLRHYAYLQKLTLALQQAGVTLALGTDASRDMPFVVPGFSAHEDLRELVAAGLTPQQALHAGTAGAARAMNAEAEFGMIAAGKRADFLLLEASPLAEVANVSRRAGVMVRGRWLPESEIQKLLAAHRAKLAKQDAFMAALIQAGPEGSLDRLRQLYRDAGEPLDEEAVNSLGYQFMNDRKDLNGAIALFRFNVAQFPQSWNAYDSLGEGYMNAGKKELAIRSYEKSVELNPQNSGGVDALKRLRSPAT